MLCRAIQRVDPQAVVTLEVIGAWAQESFRSARKQTNTRLNQKGNVSERRGPNDRLHYIPTRQGLGDRRRW